MEPMIDASLDRCTLLPIVRHDLWDLYKQAQACFWVTEEIDVEADRRDMTKLTGPERAFVNHILAFFASIDSLIGLNLAQNFYSEVVFPEARAFYGFQIAMETIHAETYGVQLETYVSDVDERERLLFGLTTIPSIKQKADWVRKWTNPSTQTFAERLVAFALVEGVLFSASFAAVFWLKKRGLTPGFAHANELISRDEGLHAKFACHLYVHYLKQTLPFDRVYEILNEAILIEDAFVEDALQVDLIGINQTLMKQYVRYVADYVLVMLHVPKLYHVANPFDWMESISLQGKTNFFERKVSEYAKAGVGVQDVCKMEFNKMDIDF
jgi:ribonucleotide reductase beta subunit family protein with ferritin-like domain